MLPLSIRFDHVSAAVHKHLALILFRFILASALLLVALWTHERWGPPIGEGLAALVAGVGLVGFLAALSFLILGSWIQMSRHHTPEHWIIAIDFILFGAMAFLLVLLNYFGQQTSVSTP